MKIGAAHAIILVILLLMLGFIIRAIVIEVIEEDCPDYDFLSYSFTTNHDIENGTYTLKTQETSGRTISMDDAVIDVMVGADHRWRVLGNVSYTLRDYMDTKNITMHNVSDYAGTHNISISVTFDDANDDEKLTDGDIFTIVITDVDDGKKGLNIGSTFMVYDKEYLLKNIGETFLRGDDYYTDEY